MKIATSIAMLALVATLTTKATTVEIPEHHRARFLAETESLQAELAAWKQSEAGLVAKKNGYYSEYSTQDASAENDQLERLYMTKLSIAQAQATNPEAVFSINTPFTLMTNDEFAQYVSKSSTLGANTVTYSNTTMAVESDITTLATSKDWTSSGCVTPVKDQGNCGDCWAFSSVGALESAYCLKNGQLQQFSEQQVNSCDTQSSGCDGGWQLWGLEYIQKNGGICTEDSYPYASGASGETGTCSTDSCSAVAIDIQSIKSVTASESALISAINVQPVSVAVAAGNNEWKQYTSGVISSCSTAQIDHAVLAVGYTSTAFTIKNQWGSSWGNSGYLQLKRNGAKSACSVVNSHNVYPVL